MAKKPKKRKTTIQADQRYINLAETAFSEARRIISKMSTTQRNDALEAMLTSYLQAETLLRLDPSLNAPIKDSCRTTMNLVADALHFAGVNITFKVAEDGGQQPK